MPDSFLFYGASMPKTRSILRKHRPAVPSHPLTRLRELALQTHRSLIELLQHPLYRHVKQQMTEAEFFELILEIVSEVNEEQGVVR
jgi:hypothetical protein